MQQVLFECISIEYGSMVLLLDQHRVLIVDNRFGDALESLESLFVCCNSKTGCDWLQGKLYSFLAASRQNRHHEVHFDPFTLNGLHPGFAKVNLRLFAIR